MDSYRWHSTMKNIKVTLCQMNPNGLKELSSLTIDELSMPEAHLSIDRELRGS